MFFTYVLNAVFSFLPSVTTLPNVMGVNVDAALTAGVNGFYVLTASIWPLRDMFIAAMIWFGYLALKMMLRVLLGARAQHA